MPFADETTGSDLIMLPVAEMTASYREQWVQSTDLTVVIDFHHKHLH